MCGRFALHANPEVVALQFGLSDAPFFQPRYNLAPSTEILVVREERSSRRHAALVRWGLIPRWAKNPALGQKLVNARGDTIAEKPAFRSAFRIARCLVPASGFYEWKTVAGRKHPYYVRPTDAELFALAGITELWHGPQGPVRTVCLITTEPNALMAEIHDRMPVIVPPERYAEWLARANQDAAQLKALLAPYPASRMQVYAVGKAVSNARNEGAELIVPVDAQSSSGQSRSGSSTEASSAGGR